MDSLLSTARAWIADAVWAVIGPFLDSDVWIRAAKTFWQAALGSLIAAAPVLADKPSWSAVVAVLGGAVAAGLSIAWNTHLDPLVARARKRAARAVSAARTNLGIPPKGQS